MAIDRSRRLKGLVGLPFIAAIVDLTSAEGHEVRDSPEHRRKLQAINAIRLINTAQRRHFEGFSQYAPLTALASSVPVLAFLDTDIAVKTTGSVLFACCNPNVSCEPPPVVHQE